MSYPTPRKTTFGASLLATMLALPAAHLVGATLYWDADVSSLWNEAANWSTDPDAATPNPGAAPTASDDVVFNISTLNTAQSITASNILAVNSIRSRSTGGVTIGGGGNRDFSIGAGGITLDAGSGALTFGTTSSGSNIFVRIVDDQTWTNNSASLLRAVNAASASPTGAAPVTLTIRNTSTGATTFSNQLNDGAEGASLALVIDSSGTGATNIVGGTFSGGLTIKSGSLVTSGSSGNLGLGAVVLGDTSGGASATLSINTTNPISSNITVQAGSSGTKTLSSNANSILNGALVLNDGLTVSPSSSTTTINGVVSGAGGITKINSAALALAGNNTYAGGTTLSAGTLRINNGGTGPTNSAIGTGALNINGGTIDNTSGDAVVLATNNVVNIGANFTFTGTNSLDLGTGSVTFGGTGTQRTITTTTAGNNLTLGGNITATSLGVIKAGDGTLRLGGVNNAYAGVTTINGGVLEVTKLADGGNNSSIGNSSNAAGNLVISSGTLRYVGGGDTTNRVFTVGTGGATLDSSGVGAIAFTNTAALSLSGSNTARTITFTGSNTGPNTFASTFGNNGTGATSVVKSGAGTWAVSSANTYTGGTQVNVGTFLVANTTGSATGTGGITVASGARFGGNGISSGLVTAVAADSVIIAGGLGSVGTLSIGGLNAANGATFVFDIDGASVDVIDFGSGSVSIGGTATFDFTGLGSVLTGHAYSLFAGSGDWSSVSASFVFNAPAGYTLDTSYGSGGYLLDAANHSLSVQFSAIPEPSAFAGLAGLGALGFAALRRRRARA